MLKSILCNENQHHNVPLRKAHHPRYQQSYSEHTHTNTQSSEQATLSNGRTWGSRSSMRLMTCMQSALIMLERAARMTRRSSSVTPAHRSASIVSCESPRSKASSRRSSRVLMSECEGYSRWLLYWSANPQFLTIRCEIINGSISEGMIVTSVAHLSPTEITNGIQLLCMTAKYE